MPPTGHVEVMDPGRNSLLPPSGCLGRSPQVDVCTPRGCNSADLDMDGRFAATWKLKDVLIDTECPSASGNCPPEIPVSAAGGRGLLMTEGGRFGSHSVRPLIDDAPLARGLGHRGVQLCPCMLAASAVRHGAQAFLPILKRQKTLEECSKLPRVEWLLPNW